MTFNCDSINTATITCLLKVQRCDGEEDCPYHSPGPGEIIDENDRGKSWDERKCIDFTPPPKSTPKPAPGNAKILFSYPRQHNISNNGKYGIDHEYISFAGTLKFEVTVVPYEITITVGGRISFTCDVQYESSSENSKPNNIVFEWSRLNNVAMSTKASGMNSNTLTLV